MKAITQNSVNSFLNDKLFKSGNTSVTESFGVFYLRLHDNIIAEKYPNGTIKITNAGWKTATTKERLNALPDVSIKQIKGVWYLNGDEWNGDLIII